MNVLQDKILLAINHRFNAGIPLPLGADLMNGSHYMQRKIQVQKDYLMGEAAIILNDNST